MENTPNHPEEPQQDPQKMHFLRHSKAAYGSYAQVLDSENPDRPIDLNKQKVPDLLPAGVELAIKEAEAFLSKLNPETTALFFVSSSQSRAFETAHIYKEIAKQKGFTILAPEHPRNTQSNSDAEIRVVRALSLKPDSSLWASIYNPPAYMAPINWDAVDSETKARWDAARTLILADDKGSWGANYAHYSDLLKQKKMLPDTESTAEELFSTQFQQLLILARFGAQKASSGHGGKKIEIIVVGHENYMTEAMETYFNEEMVNNCEVINISVAADGRIEMTKKGKKMIVS